MARLLYQAIDQSGRVLKGTLVATHESELERRLQERGLTLISAKPANKERKAGPLTFSLTSTKVKPRMLVEFYRRFAQTLEMGLPILEGLEENAKVIPSKPLRKTIEEVKAALEEGSTLHDAMAKFPEVFDRLDLGIIRMGEQSGVLPECLADLAAFLEWKEETRGIIKRATIYPSFVMLTIFGVIGVWVGYVLPQVGSLLREMGVELPAITRAILAASEFLQAAWMWMGLGLLAVVAAFVVALKTERGKRLFHRLLLRVPLAGRIAANIAYTRLTHNFATMHRAGMPITKIFEVLSDHVLGNRYLESQVAAAHRELQAGQSLAESFDATGAFPPLLVGGIRHGEITGGLEESFKRLGEYYDGEVKRSVETLVNSFEPLIMLLLGGVFGMIILSILLPLYDVLSGVGQAY